MPVKMTDEEIDRETRKLVEAISILIHDSPLPGICCVEALMHCAGAVTMYSDEAEADPSTENISGLIEYGLHCFLVACGAIDIEVNCKPENAHPPH